ncbi:MAG: cupin domain-containing protein [Betaproteobacteria bacterium]|nr:cupin domain-containing protein [Betaproteobacteria bacterium]
MTKPIANLDEVEFTDIEANGFYTSKRAQFSAAIGAKQLGYNLTELAPGCAQCPFHSHRCEEEMFLILDGEGELRYGKDTYRIKKHDVIACPTGGPETAHQIINTGSVPLRYLSLSTMADVEVCEYPDSDKVGVYAGGGDAPRLRKLVRSESGVDYYDRESTEPRRQKT